DPVATVLPRTGWTATASASCSGDTPAKALDDDINTRFSTCQNQTSGQSFQLDMKAPMSFSSITLNAGSSNSAYPRPFSIYASSDYPRGYAVYASNDPSNFGSAIMTGSGSASLVAIGLPATTARYIRIVQTGAASSWWSISELNVWQTAVSSCVTAANCDDGDRCTTDSCDLVLGCVHALVACTRQGRIEAESFDLTSGTSNNGTSMSPLSAGA